MLYQRVTLFRTLEHWVVQVTQHRNPHIRLHREENPDDRRLNSPAMRTDEVADCLAKFAAATGWGIRSTLKKSKSVAIGEELSEGMFQTNASLSRGSTLKNAAAAHRWELVDTSPVDGLLECDDLNSMPAVSQQTASQLLHAIERLVARLELAEDAVRHQQAQLATDVSISRNKDEAVEIADRLEAILASSCRSIQATAAAIYLLDDSTSELKMRACWNLPVERLLAPPRALRGSMADLEALLGNAVLIDDTAYSSNWPSPEDFASALVVPIGSASMPQGTIWYWTDRTRNYSATEVEVANMASGRVMNELEQSVLGVEVQNSRTIVKQLDQASIAQAARWPDASPMHSDIELDGWSIRENSLGGAFHDWDVNAAEDIVAMFGDTLSSGPQGAIVAASIHSIVRSGWANSMRPTDILASVGDYLFAGGADDWAANASLLQLHPSTGRGTLVTAGNNQLFIISHRGFRPIAIASKPLATTPTVQNQTTKFVLQPGEVLIGMSSNLVEQLNLPAAINTSGRNGRGSSEAYNKLRRQRRSLSKTFDQNELLREIKEMLDEEACDIARHIANRLPTFVQREGLIGADRSLLVIRNAKKAIG